MFHGVECRVVFGLLLVCISFCAIILNLIETAYVIGDHAQLSNSRKCSVADSFITTSVFFQGHRPQSRSLESRMAGLHLYGWLASLSCGLGLLMAYSG